MKVFRKKSQGVSQPARRSRRSIEERQSAEDVSREQVFRRNRTLTGSSSSRVTSSSEQSAHLKSPRVHAHHLSMTRRRIGALLVATLGVVVVLFFLISQFTARVTVSIQGAPQQAGLLERYEPLAQDYLARHPAERLRFLFNSAEFNQYLQVKAPEIENVSIDGTGQFGTSHIVLVARRPVASWVVSGRQEFVDTDGRAFTVNYYDTPGVEIVDSSGLPTTDGQIVVSNRFLGFIGQLVGSLTKQGLTVEQVIIPTNTTRQVDVRISGVGYPVKSSVDRSAVAQAEDTARVIRHLQKTNTNPEYIDVRVEGKAFYK